MLKLSIGSRDLNNTFSILYDLNKVNNFICDFKICIFSIRTFVPVILVLTMGRASQDIRARNTYVFAQNASQEKTASRLQVK